MTTHPPIDLSFAEECIPQDLKAINQWVCWAAVWDEHAARWDKVPKNARTERNASTTDPTTWSDFETAKQAASATTRGGSPLGIGFVLTRDLGIVGLDFDKCVGAAAGAGQTSLVRFSEWISRIDSYAELSPSGTGVRAFVRGTVPQGFKRGGAEAYVEGRFLTVTGRPLHGTPFSVKENARLLEDLYAKFGSPRSTQSPAAPVALTTSSVDASKIMERIRRSRDAERFTQFMAGTIDRVHWNSDESRIDFAFARLLARWCGSDLAAIEAIMRQSLLARAKWDERRPGGTWIRETIARAIEMQPAAGLSSISSVEAAFEAFRGLNADRPKKYNLLLRRHQYFGMFELGEVHTLQAMSTAGKSSFAIWMAAHWANGEAFSKGFPCIRPSYGFSVYFGKDPSFEELLRKMERFSYAELTETTQSVPWCGYEPMGGSRFHVCATDGGTFGMDPNGHETRFLDSLHLDPEGIENMVTYVECLKQGLPTRTERRTSYVRPGLGPEYKEVCIEPVGLIIIDSLSDFLPPGTNELDNLALKRANANLKALARRTNSAVLVLHHVSKAEHATSWKDSNPLTYGRGGTAFAAGSRVKMVLQPVERTDRRVLGFRMFANNFPVGADILFEVRGESDPTGYLNYFKVISETELSEIQEKEGGPEANLSKEAIWQATLAKQGPLGVTETTIRRALGELMQRAEDNKKVISEAKKLREEWVREGRLCNEKKQGNGTYYEVRSECGGGLYREIPPPQGGSTEDHGSG